MLFFSKDESYFNILVDIGSGNLSTSLVLYKKGQKPTFVYTCSKDTEALEKVDLLKMEQNIVTLFDQSILEVIQSGFKSFKEKIETNKEIKNVVVSLSSPWFFLKTKNVEVNKPKPFLITENYLKDLTKGEVEQFEEEIKKLNDNPDSSYEVVEKSIVNVKVNGYTISKIIGQKTSTFSAYMCMSLVESNFINKIHEIVGKHTHLSEQNVFVHTLPLVSFTVMRDLFNGFDNFVSLNISSEYSDLSYVSNGVLVKTSSFPSGRNFLIRQIAKELSLPNEIAESSLRLFVAKKLDGENSQKIEEVLINVEKEWSIYFEKALSDVSPTGQFPARLYLSSYEDVSQIYTEMIKLEKADITADFRKSVNLITVNNSIFNGIVGNQSHTLPDDNLSVLAMFWNKFAFQ